MGAILDDAVFHAPALAAGMLEVKITEVHTGAKQLAEGALQASGIQAAGAQAVLGKRQGDVSHGSRSGDAGRSGKPREQEGRAHRGRGRPVTVGGMAGAGAGAGGGALSRLRSITSTLGSFHGPVTL